MGLSTVFDIIITYNNNWKGKKIFKFFFLWRESNYSLNFQILISMDKKPKMQNTSEFFIKYNFIDKNQRYSYISNEK